MPTSNAVAVGFTIKSGWTSAVVVAGGGASPRLVACRTLDLSDPDVPEARQPYHDGFGTARAPGAALRRLVSAVQRFGRRSVVGFIEEIARGAPIRGGGVVVGSTIEPSTLGNTHMRIHAMEGQLFRTIVQSALAECRLTCRTWRARDLYAAAAVALKQPEPTLRADLAALRHFASGPWRAEQKAAALAAWLVLADRASVRRA